MAFVLYAIPKYCLKKFDSRKSSIIDIWLSCYQMWIVQNRPPSSPWPRSPSLIPTSPTPAIFNLKVLKIHDLINNNYCGFILEANHCKDVWVLAQSFEHQTSKVGSWEARLVVQIWWEWRAKDLVCPDRHSPMGWYSREVRKLEDSEIILFEHNK